ncbi:hypothetical protein KSX_69610 [Ktedonospora formicarum]|uniref:Uncharacterized protein n=2 Tax=Ktedonospora formicarum TaxID=2778364 RepID=A0A8J3IAN4_9CHLR|nr:hypothetical protein KSX_69610 [Ktedonospora formicarum]
MQAAQASPAIGYNNWGRIWKWTSKTYKGQFTLQASALLVLALLLALLSSQAVSRASEDLDTIGNDSIPSVDAAQAMAQYVEDIDAKAADYLAAVGLTELQPCVVPGPNTAVISLTVHACDDHTIDAEIQLFNQELYKAAHNVTYPGERTAIERITAGFEEYTSHIAVMRSEFTQATNTENTHDPHMLKAWQAYVAASNVLHSKIAWQPPVNAQGHVVFNESNVPSCLLKGQSAPATTWVQGSIEDILTCFGDINKSHLDAAYNDTSSFLDGSRALLFALCVLFCVLLLLCSLRLAGVTHRVVNIGLTPAFLVSIFLSFSVISLFNGMAGRHGAYGQMVKDDYDSVYYAAQLKRSGTMANADESRWLVSLRFGDQEQTTRWANDWKQNVVEVQSLLARARNNRTWKEEDQPLTDMQHNWSTYYTIDARIRDAAGNGSDQQQILQAEHISTGESNQTFSKFLDAVDRLSQANRAHYQETFAGIHSTLAISLLLYSLLYPLVGLAAAWGIARRFKDF